MSGLSRAIGLRHTIRQFSTGRVLFGGNPEGWDGTVPEEHKNKKELLSAGMGYYDFYCGHPSYPAESVRFLPDSPYVANVLRPKEMQDWKALSLEEKKTLYRTAYQQTVCEQKAGEPGAYIGDLAFVIFYFAITGAWFLYYINVMTPFPMQLDPEIQERIIQNELASYREYDASGVFDYETNQLVKKKWWHLPL